MPKGFLYIFLSHTDFFLKILIFFVIHTDFVLDQSGRSVRGDDDEDHRSWWTGLVKYLQSTNQKIKSTLVLARADQRNFSVKWLFHLLPKLKVSNSGFEMVLIWQCSTECRYNYLLFCSFSGGLNLIAFSFLNQGCASHAGLIIIALGQSIPETCQLVLGIDLNFI